MRFGIRECCDVVFRAKSYKKIGNKNFYKDEPVIYFDSLKTSTLEGAATTVYAQGGRGNSRLLAWEGERTLTFTMEDALISPEGISILTGAGIIEATSSKKIFVHTTEEVAFGGDLGFKGELSQDKLTVTECPIGVGTATAAQPIHWDSGVYAMLKDSNGNIITEPFSSKTDGAEGKLKDLGTASNVDGKMYTKIGIDKSTALGLKIDSLTDCSLFIDYYLEKESGAYQIDITPDQFGGYFYIEASTLFRDQATGDDMPAEFIIPNGKVQSNFTFTMSSSGDPSTFTFTVDAFPGKVKGGTKDVLAAIQVIEETSIESNDKRTATDADTNEATEIYHVVGSTSFYKGDTQTYRIPELGTSETVNFTVAGGSGTTAINKSGKIGTLVVDDADLGKVLTISATVTGKTVAPLTVYTYNL